MSLIAFGAWLAAAGAILGTTAWAAERFQKEFRSRVGGLPSTGERLQHASAASAGAWQAVRADNRAVTRAVFMSIADPNVEKLRLAMWNRLGWFVAIGFGGLPITLLAGRLLDGGRINVVCALPAVTLSAIAAILSNRMAHSAADGASQGWILLGTFLGVLAPTAVATLIARRV